MSTQYKLAERIWTCKIGGFVGDLPGGADAPMRCAIDAAFSRVTGSESAYIFSGWGGTLDEFERAVVENRLPVVAASPNLGGEGLTEEYILELAEKLGAVSYTPPPMRAVRGLSFTFEQLGEFVDAIAARVALSRTGEAAQGDALDARWQPIETAPKTQESQAAEMVILGFAPDEEGFSPSTCEGFWNPPMARWVSSLDPGWKQSPQPTHWMPLPPPPSTTAPSTGETA